ncbi:MAG TPA: methyltransferase domain-containing protein [Steroidobacteraceae bacterium]|jgi:predicted methyltransferase|nr:methyltransferase domain-containing protein [Steroidobacteraceae bacterium]
MQPRNIAAGIALGAFVAMAASTFAATGKKDVAAIEQAVAGDWRKPESKERDGDRHPAASLEFWGLKPKMTILEVQPGGGWWTEILAPYARATQGEFYATAPDLADPDLSENAKKGRANFEARWANADVYGKVNLVNWGPKAAPLPADKFDFVMLTRGMHGWVRDGRAEANLANIFNAVKPGGVLAIEQHRAKPGQDPKTFNGYLDEAYVISLVEKAGFKLDAKSEINANPKDTKDHPYGVWTLPPTRQSSAGGEGGNTVDPNFDRAKYDAIGESDRMTLRFVKPRK